MDEVAALESVDTWDVSSICERHELEEWAQRDKITIHIGEGLGICSIKNSEMPLENQKWKGRFCFRTPTCRDEGGAVALGFSTLVYCIQLILANSFS